MAQFSEAALRGVITGYEATKSAALQQRDAQLREFHAGGWRPIDLQRVTGYSRETIRQALRPEVREAANTSRRKQPDPVVAPPSGGYASYGERKPYQVAQSLDELIGPTEGTVSLPKHLDWSGDATYALDRPTRLASMYRTVLNEAGSIEDLKTWLNGRVLAELWPTLWLPAKVRQLWESRFPQLAGRRTQAA